MIGSLKYLKRITGAFLLPVMLFLLAGCASEENYKDARAKVVTYHDKLMLDMELTGANKLKLDSISDAINASTSPAKAKDGLEVIGLIGQIVQADNAMSRWMIAFEPDIKGKSNKEAVAYFKEEGQKLVRMDSLYKVAIKNSDAYLKEKGIEPHKHDDGHNH